MGAALYAAAYALVESHAPPSLLLVLTALQRRAPFISAQDLQVNLAHSLSILPSSTSASRIPMHETQVCKTLAWWGTGTLTLVWCLAVLGCRMWPMRC